MSAVELHFCRTTVPLGHLQGQRHPPSVFFLKVLTRSRAPGRAVTNRRWLSDWHAVGAMSPQLRLGSTVCRDQRPHEVPHVHREPSSSHSPLRSPPSSSSDVTTLVLLRDKAEVASSSVNTHGLVPRPGTKGKRNLSCF